MIRALFAFALVALCLVLVAPEAFAQAAAAPVAGDWLGGVVSLWGPLLGVIAALVLFFDRLAKVIPNSTTSGVLKGISWVATILGVKVPDNQ